MGGKRIVLLDDEQWPNQAFGFTLPIHPQAAVLGIIDVQHYAVDAAGHLAETLRCHSPNLYENYARDVRNAVESIRKLLSAFRTAERRVFFTRHGSQVPDSGDLVLRRQQREEAARAATKERSGHMAIKGEAAYEIVPEVAPILGELVVDKDTSSAFHTTAIDLILRNMNVDTLVLVGITADQCVFATALDAADRGFHVIICSDACAAIDRGGAEAVQVLFGRVWGYVMRTDSIIRWLNTGKTPEKTRLNVCEGSIKRAGQD